MTTTTLAFITGQLLSVAVVGWAVGDWALSRIAGREVGLCERALAAVLGFIAFALGLMVGHIIAGGVVFGTSWLVPVAGSAVVIFGIRRKAWPRSVPWVPLVAAVALLGALFLLPAVSGGSGVRTGDIPWHLGWSEQLLGGEPVPTGPAPEYGENAYPWGFHAVIATIVRMVPGSTPLVALETLHFLVVVAVPLAAACLARRVDLRAGWAAAGAATLIGGWGWIVAEKPDFIVSPSLTRYGADLVVASPNAVYELFPPALPRELGLVTLAGAGVAIVWATRDGGRRASVAAGLLLGITGLISIPLVVAGSAWLIAGSLSARRTGKWLLLAGAPVALGVVSLWLGPVVAAYLRNGGFVNITPQLGVEWPVTAALWSWGLLLPVAIAGVGVVLVARRHQGRSVIALGIATVILLGFAVARGEFGWQLGGNATLLHQGRVWPVAHLLGAAFAGIALTAAYAWARRRSRAMAVAGTALFVAVASVSPAFASIKLTEVIQTYEGGYLYHRPDFDDDAFVIEATEELSSRDVVRVPESDFLAFLLFSFSGARLAAYDDDRLDHNDLRIRYANLADRWDERIASGGFGAGYTALREAESPPGAVVVVRGEFREEPWVLVRGDFGSGD